jgi:hypothetical protein
MNYALVIEHHGYPANLAPGTYQGAVTITSADAGDSPSTVPVCG